MPTNKDFNHKQYQENYQQYLESNQDGRIGGATPAERVAFLSDYLTSGSSVFEIGSGGGDDAIELQKAGYIVIASDYIDEFVELLKGKGLQATNFDARLDSLPGHFDAVYANAVFVHFTSDEFKGFLRTVKDNLKRQKMLFFTVIKGEGHERSARSRGFERDFYYYSYESIEKLLLECGYSIIAVNDKDSKWLQVITTVIK